MTDIDRQKYVAELSKLLSGMARADREAVIRGVNARFDETGDDNAVIAALGSPTFAAVTVLRGYTPPEDGDYGEDEHEEDYQYGQSEPAPEPEPEAGPDAEPEYEPVPEAPEAESGGPGINAAPEAGSSADEPGQIAPEAVAEPIAEPEPEPAAEAAAGPEPAVEPEPAAEPEPEPEKPAETVLIGLDSIEVYSDGSIAEAVPESAVPAEPEYAPEPGPEAESEAEPEPDSEAEPEPAPEAEPEYDDGPEAVYEDGSEPEYVDDESEAEPEYVPGPDKPEMKGGRVFLCALLGIIVGIPLAAVLTIFALAVLAVGAALLYAGGVVISFAFLGMNVAADIMLCVGFGLAVCAVGLPVVYFAFWFFVRCVAGLYSRLFAKAGSWCRGEVRE